MLIRSIFASLLTLGLAAAAEAHFIWADLVATKDQPPEIRLCFGESAEPGDAQLVGKIAQSKAWVRGVDGATTPAPLAVKIEGPSGALVGLSPTPRPLSVEAECDYGVYQRAPGGAHLLYYAKHLADDWPGQPAPALEAAGLKLDIVPSLAGGKLQLLVRFAGQPDPDREVVIDGPGGGNQKLKTDAQGRVAIDAAPGRYAIRAGHVDAGQQGTLDGKPFAQTSYYATLTLTVNETAARGAAAANSTAPSAEPAAGASTSNSSSRPSSSDDDARELLRQARLARAVWEKFPGYTADVVVSWGGSETPGKVTIDSYGVVTVEMPDGPERKWVEAQLASLAQHRMPEGEIAAGAVRVADSDAHHPLGRRIDLGDPKLGSVYRIRDNVIYEVNRNAGPLRFTISVLDVTWNEDHKYLPRCFVMNFFDAASGELKQSTAYLNEWRRVGAFDLPARILEIEAGGKSQPVRQMLFTNLKLGK